MILLVKAVDQYISEIMLETKFKYYRAFARDVTAAILVPQNNEMAAILVS